LRVAPQVRKAEAHRPLSSDNLDADYKRERGAQTGFEERVRM